jgi:hypothetical protein
MSDEAYKLEPCPLCGGTASIREVPRDAVHGQEPDEMMLYCVVCTDTACGGTTQDYRVWQSAVEAWNRKEVLVPEIDIEEEGV